MRTLWVALMLAAATPACAAEPDTNTVTVTVASAVEFRADQVELYVSLLTPVDAGLDEVLKRLKGSEISEADLNYVYTPYSNPFEPSGYTQWTFTPAIAFDRMKTVLAALSQLEASGETVMGSPALRFEVMRIRSDESSTAANSCPFAAMISDARRQADEMAAAAGMRTGVIVSLSDGSSIANAGFGGVGTPAPNSMSPSSLLIRNISVACSLTVQFELL